MFLGLFPLRCLRESLVGVITLASFWLSIPATRAQASALPSPVNTDQIAAGANLTLDGQWWSYSPGYLVAKVDHPESAAPAELFRVPVPQLLNRIYWWLDDSEDFKRREDERLRSFGFDTEKAEDGWYYLWLNCPTQAPERHLFIEFEGAAMKCRAYCNGHLLGDHTGMFSRFSFDLSPHLKTGTNLLAVYVAMEKIPPSSLSMGEAVTVNLTASKVRSLSKGMFGPLAPGYPNRAYDLHGIWQPVKIKVRDTARLDDVWFSPSLDGAEVRVQASSLLKLQRPVQAAVKARWTDTATGELFAETEPEKLRIRTNTTTTLWLRNVHPKFWTPAAPNLYKLNVSLESEDGKLLDSWEHNVGFRTFEVHGSELFLNGKPYWLRGADHLPYGKNPSDSALARRLIQMLHDANVRITRTHATPWNEAWLNAADEIGLAVSVEGIRPWGLAGKIGATPSELFQHWLYENEDVVKRLRNHPSVFIYTIGNEMMLRDSKNPEKWKQLSAVVKQTRKLDPTRPVIASSEYQREPELYKELLEPNGIDDGDIDDIHRYNNWYGPSSFVTNSLFGAEMKKREWPRPFIGQEMSSGYPDLDTGLPVLRYTKDLLTPQAWVGEDAYPGHNPEIFFAHHAAVTKRWAEQLRYQRGTNTAGFMMFAAECWARHSYDSGSVAAYPVFDRMREAWSPVGVALDSGRRRFYSGDDVKTVVHITNDSDDFSDLTDLALEAAFDDAPGTNLATVPALPYYAVTNVTVRLQFPKTSAHRETHNLILKLMHDGKEISRSTEPIELFGEPASPTRKFQVVGVNRGLGPRLKGFMTTQFGDLMEASIPADFMGSNLVVLVGATGNYKDLGVGSLRAAVESGATAILFSPGDEIAKLFPDDITDTKPGIAEFADPSPIRGTALAQGLESMDLKWWGRADDWRVFIGSQSHRLRAGGKARILLRYIPPHSYISADKVPEQYRTVMFEIPLGHGRIWVCDLDLETSINVDPAARLFAENLCRAAADRNSSSALPKLLTHEELLQNVKR